MLQPYRSSLLNPAPDMEDEENHRQPLPDFLFPWQVVLRRDILRPDSAAHGHLAHYRIKQFYLLSPGLKDARNGIR